MDKTYPCAISAFALLIAACSLMVNEILVLEKAEAEFSLRHLTLIQTPSFYGQSSMGRSTFRMGYFFSIHGFKASSFPCLVSKHHCICTI